MLNLLEMDTFLAGLSEDFVGLFPISGVKDYITQQLNLHKSTEEVHTNLEKLFVVQRVSKNMPPRDPKPFSGVVKKMRVVVYNQWSKEDLDKYALSKTASVQSKWDELWMDSLCLDLVSPTTSYLE